MLLAVCRYRIERSYGPWKVSISHRAMTPPFTAVFFCVHGAGCTGARNTMNKCKDHHRWSLHVWRARQDYSGHPALHPFGAAAAARQRSNSLPANLSLDFVKTAALRAAPGAPPNAALRAAARRAEGRMPEVNRSATPPNHDQDTTSTKLKYKRKYSAHDAFSQKLRPNSIPRYASDDKPLFF